MAAANGDNDVVSRAERRLAEWRRRLLAEPWAPAVGAGLLALEAVIEETVRLAHFDKHPPFAVALILLALFTTLPMALLGRVASVAAVTGACLLSLVAFQTLSVAALVTEVIVLYRFGRQGSSSATTQLWAIGLALPWLILALATPNPLMSEAGFLTVFLAVLAPMAAWAGIARHARSEAQIHSAASELIAGTLIEHTARGERARIVRELHDVVAHHVSMIAVQAETARLTTPGMPIAGATRLSEIGDIARTALTEMRGLLGVLREDAQSEIADRRPQPGLKQLNDLLDAARTASGSGTRLILSGRSVILDPVVELAAYRIAQEALTNARRHAPGAAVDVELEYCDGGLRLRIRDNGPGPPSETLGGGHGLTGMRERAAAVGGELRAGEATGGGFIVEVTLPATSEEVG
jgi:signal transduction histidine kinase